MITENQFKEIVEQSVNSEALEKRGYSISIDYVRSDIGPFVEIYGIIRENKVSSFNCYDKLLIIISTDVLNKNIFMSMGAVKEYAEKMLDDFFKAREE